MDLVMRGVYDLAAHPLATRLIPRIPTNQRRRWGQEGRSWHRSRTPQAPA